MRTIRVVAEASSLGLGDIMVLQYIRVFRNPDSIIFNTIKNTDASLSFKLLLKCRIEMMYCSAQYVPPVAKTCFH